ncbi:MAG: PQQ-binding-like beta-propeller repeat protein [Chloroflexi bacterium]|nr:PQQ-binding-like beta-propeller repeat protein [Chloroflexota bacterium]
MSFDTSTTVLSTKTSDVSATPTVVDNTVYFPDWGGWLYAVDAHSGKARWTTKVSDYNGVAGSLSRTSPAVAGDLLILGDKPPNGTTGWGQDSKVGAHVFAVDAHTGKLAWITQVDSTFVSQITGSPVVFNGVVYVGVSSVEEITAAFVPGYQCIFRGSEVALDARTGKVLWQTFDMPSGYTGGAIWGSSAAIDPDRGDLYVGTGNNYSVPASVQACHDAGGTNCDSPDDHVDSLMAFDLRTGAVKWATGTLSFDNWTVGCILSALPNCPSPKSADADFGSGPNVFFAGGKALVGAGTKGGTYWALDDATGKVVWATQVGPGGIFGGIEWGSSVADGRVYVAESNSGHGATTLTHPSPGSASSTSGGFWEALNAATGEILWQTPDPAGPTFGDIGQTATSNGVVYAGSSDAAGHVYALNGATGKIKWSFATGGSIGSGASIVNGTVYWGSGYGQFASSGTTGNNKVYAFSLPHEDDN